MGAREKTRLQDDAIDSSPKSVAVECSSGPPAARLESGGERVCSEPSVQGLDFQRLKQGTKEASRCVEMEEDEMTTCPPHPSCQNT